MTQLREITFADINLDGLAGAEGHVALLVNAAGTMTPGTRRLNRLTKGAIARTLASERWDGSDPIRTMGPART